MWEPFCSAEITNIITITNINLQLRILMMLHEMVNVVQGVVVVHGGNWGDKKIHEKNNTTTTQQ